MLPSLASCSNDLIMTTTSYERFLPGESGSVTPGLTYQETGPTFYVLTWHVFILYGLQKLCLVHMGAEGMSHAVVSQSTDSRVQSEGVVVEL